jgi:hypothetical protein
VPPDVAEFRAFLARATRRMAWIQAAEGAAGGLLLAAALGIVGWPSSNGVAIRIALAVPCMAAGVAIRALLGRHGKASVAASIETRAPECRNIVITADELSSGARVSERIGTVVHREAARIVRSLDLAALFPARNAVVALVVALGLWSATIAATGASGAVTMRALRGPSPTATVIDGVDVTVTPPAYTGRPAETSHDPTRIEALAGSRVHLVVQSRAVNVGIEMVGGHDTLVARRPGTFSGEFQADADGYIALQPVARDGQRGAARLIGVSVISDKPPRVRITTPAKDLFLRDAHHTIDLAVETSDDIALASLRLRYTKVSGSGERFAFTDGEVPLAVVRTDARTWTARTSWPLDNLGLDAGDLVVYRAVATDHRPGAPPAESDSYIAEILAPGGVAAPGFALDPDVERYAVSQQMVIVKTERLLARRASMQLESFADSAHELAAEQRKVRAEFVFMMGGEIADENADAISDLNEEQEAEGESDLLAGRMQNRGRIALLRAIRSMSRAAASLTTAELTPALTHERAALTQLERAFSHTRIILRALTEHERLDLTRRLTGSLTDAARDTRPAVELEPNARVASLRTALADIATLAGTRPLSGGAAARASSLAASVLRIDPSSKMLQDASALLARAGDALANGNTAAASDALDRAATSVAATLRAELLDAPSAKSAADLDRLRGALSDALRRPRGER